MQRRTACAGMLAALAGAAGAQNKTARPLTAVGVFSLLGDAVEVTVNDTESMGTRTESVQRQELQFRNIGFDLIALRMAREAVAQRWPQAQVAVYASNVQVAPMEQRRIADGAREGALPEWIISAVQSRKLSHVLLVTRGRRGAALVTGDQDTIGRGLISGLGFYLDRLYQVQNKQTGALMRGAIGPHVLVQLTLMDTDSAEVVASATINEQWLAAGRDTKVDVDPWNQLSGEEKVAALREGLERGLGRALPELLAAR